MRIIIVRAPSIKWSNFAGKAYGGGPDFIIGTPNLVRGLKVGVVHHE